MYKILKNHTQLFIKMVQVCQCGVGHYKRSKLVEIFFLYISALTLLPWNTQKHVSGGGQMPKKINICHATNQDDRELDQVHFQLHASVMFLLKPVVGNTWDFRWRRISFMPQGGYLWGKKWENPIISASERVPLMVYYLPISHPSK